ncbi:MAG TPA: ABC transporter substrate-binding protein [Tissierellaceae bacterium]
MKKVFIWTICLLLGLSLILSGCGSKGEQENNEAVNTGSSEEKNDSGSVDEGESIVTPPGTYPLVTKKITLKAFAPKLPYVTNIAEGNNFTEWLEEKTNVHIEWELAPQDSFGEKKNLMLASGDYPDIIFGVSKQEEMTYGPQGVLLPLNDLIEENCINFKKVLEERPFLKGAITTPDGNIYSLPTINECYHCMYAMRAWINKKWLDNLGLDMPTTTDEYYEVLKAFKYNDPNGNGKQDEIPLSGAVGGWHTNVANFFINSFIYNDGENRFIFKDGKLDFAANKPEFREALRYLNKLYTEGLMDKAALTQDVQQLIQLGTNPEVNILGSATAALWWNFSDSDNVENPRNREYVAMSPLKGPNGVQYAAYYPFGFSTGAFAIFSNCKYPEVAIRLADFLYTYEGTLLSTVGPEGVAWRWAKEGEKGLHGEKAMWVMLKDITVTEFNDCWGEMGPYYKTNEFRLGQAAPEQNPWDTEYRLYKESKEKMASYAPPVEEIFPPVYILPEDLDEYARLSTQIKDYVDESIAKFITGALDLDKDWDVYVKEFEKLELDKFLQINQKAYEAQYK